MCSQYSNCIICYHCDEYKLLLDIAGVCYNIYEAAVSNFRLVLKTLERKPIVLENLKKCSRHFIPLVVL